MFYDDDPHLTAGVGFLCGVLRDDNRVVSSHGEFAAEDVRELSRRLTYVDTEQERDRTFTAWLLDRGDGAVGRQP